MSDRRTSLRFEIVGRLRGSLATDQRVRVIDVSPGGALIEMATLLPVDSHHNVQVRSDDRIATFDARVRHVRPALEMGRFLIGLEFGASEQLVAEALGHTALGQEPA